MKRFLPSLMIFAAGFCLRVGISSLSPVLGDIQADLQIGNGALGVLTAIPVICMGVLSPIAFFLEGKVGMKRAMLIALGLLFVGLALRLEPSGYPLLLITAGMVGIADAIIRPLLSGFIKSSFPSSAAAPMSIYAASMGIGSAMAAFGTAKISGELGQGWGAGLAFWAIPVAIAWIVWAVWRQQPIPHAHHDNTAALVMRRGDIVALTLFFGLQAGVNYTVIAWLPTLYTNAGFQDQFGGLLVAVFVLIQTVVSLFYHNIERGFRLSRSASGILFSALGLAGCVSLLFLSQAPWVTPILLGIATGALFPVALIFPLDFASNPQAATKLAGLVQSGGYLLGGLLPWIAGVATDVLGIATGISSLMIACSIVLALTAATVSSIYRHHGVPHEPS